VGMDSGDQAAATPNHRPGATSPPPSPVATLPEEMRLAFQVLATEYNMLMAALGAAWSASLTRTSLFLGVLSAAGVAFGFASQGGMKASTFLALALLVLVLVLFLGVATFVRLVEVQRESMVYFTGMNRIRHFFHEVAPASRPYFVLPIYDDEVALYRSVGTGMRRNRPRPRLLYLTVQTQGIVGIVTAVVAAGCGGLAVSPVGSAVAWLVATVAFVVTPVALFVYWHRALTDMHAAIRPIHPMPTERINVPV
jgi:hypothetical protein